MFYLTLRFAFIAVLFQAPCTVVAQDANSVVKNMLGMREKQNSCITKHINSLPKTAILVTIETISKAKGGSQKYTALKLCNRQSEGGSCCFQYLPPPKHAPYLVRLPAIIKDR